MEVVLADPELSLDLKGSVENVHEEVVDNAPVSVALIHTETPLSLELVGRNVKVEIVVAASTSPVPAVPVAAVRTGADGTTRVDVIRSSRRKTLKIDVGLVAGGWVEVTSDTTLKVGDRVVVG